MFYLYIHIVETERAVVLIKYKNNYRAILYTSKTKTTFFYSLKRSQTLTYGNICCSRKQVS